MNVEPFALDLAAPLATATGTVERREGFLVRATLDGTEGVGEATPLPPWTEPLSACRDALDALPAAPEAARDAVDPTETPAAAHGVELAVLDARSRAAGVPLAEQLTSGGTASSVPVNATVGDADPDDTAAAAQAAVERGFGTIKVKVGARGVAADGERLRAVREAVGPTVEFRADANGGWTRDEADRALEVLASVGVAYVEQPLPPADLAGLADLRGGPVAIAADESLATHSLDAVLDAGAADAVVLKPMPLGGPARTVAAAERARRADVTPVVTTTIDAVHARTAAVHVAAALRDPPACGLATASMLASDLAADPAPVAAGEIRVPDGPGNLGIVGERA